MPVYSDLGRKQYVVYTRGGSYLYAGTSANGSQFARPQVDFSCNNNNGVDQLEKVVSLPAGTRGMLDLRAH